MDMLLLSVVVELLSVQLAKQSSMFLHLGLGEVDIDLEALAEELGSLRRVLHEEVAHDDVGCHLVEVTGAEVQELLILCFLHGSYAGIELLGHSLE